MREAAGNVGRKAIALVVLLVALWLLLKVVIGFVSAVAWVVVVIAAVIAVLWAANTLFD